MVNRDKERAVARQGADLVESEPVGQVTPAARSGWGWEVALLPMVVASIGYSLWTAVGQAHIGPVTVDPLDIGLGIALAACGVLWVKRGVTDPTPTTWLATASLVSALFAPVLVGLVLGHEWQSVFRVARVTACYTLIVLAAQLIKDRRAAERLMLSVTGVTVAAAAFAALSMVMGWQWQSGLSQVPTSFGIVNRGYGLPSALTWYPLGSLFCFAYTLSGVATRTRRTIIGLAGVGLFAITAVTLVRSSYLALAAGIAVMLLIVTVQHGGLTITARWVGWRRLAAGIGVVAIVVVALWIVHPRYLSIFTQRAASVVETGTSSGADYNRQMRILALETGGHSAVQAPFGIGYGWGGYGLSSPSPTDITLSYFAAHSSYGWAGLYLGVFGVAVFGLGVAVIAVRLLRSLKPPRNWWVSTAIASAAVALLVQSLGAAVFFSNPETYAMIPILFAVGLLPTRNREKPAPVPAGAALIPAKSTHAYRPWSPRFVKTVVKPRTRLERLGAIAAGGGLCVVAAAAVLLASATAGNAIVLGSTVYGQPTRLLIAPGGGHAHVDGTLTRQNQPNSTLAAAWFMPTDGSLTTYVRCTRGGSYALTVVASGTLAQGVGPLVGLEVDGSTQGGPRYVQTYLLPYTWRVFLRPGIHEIDVRYMNDAIVDRQDRNLFIASLSLESVGSAPRLAYASRSEFRAQTPALSGQQTPQ